MRAASTKQCACSGERTSALAQRKVLTRGQFFSLHAEVDAVHGQRLRIHLAVVQRDGLELFSNTAEISTTVLAAR